MTLLTAIKAEAFDLGFLVCGTTSPDKPTHFDAYLAWLSSGRMAGMGYMAREDAVSARQDPRQLLASCRSILCLAAPYPQPLPLPNQDPSKPLGIISAYACLPDYHELLRGKLNLLVMRIEGLLGHPIESLACIDTAPILEKDYAQAAGLGWVGRNTLLNAPGYGSWLFLTELLTDLELPGDTAPLQDPCRDCTRCVDACPTQALQPGRSLDAGLCLSYLTLEHRGSIPEGLRSALGMRIVGCDICQSVCPANQNLPSQPSESLFQPVVSPFPELLTAFALSEAEFNACYARTPVMRSKYAGFRRNVAIALGNSGSRAAIPVLQNALATETDLVLLDACAWALAQLLSPA